MKFSVQAMIQLSGFMVSALTVPNAGHATSVKTIIHRTPDSELSQTVREYSRAGTCSALLRVSLRAMAKKGGMRI